MAPALEISIPTTSTANPQDSKAYTLYHITLRLPLRTQEVKKRYSDFEKLHSSLESETNASPPSPLPAKSWFRRTVNNESLTEERRQGLEKYIKAIIAAEDARWRSSSAWRAFLNLPSGTNTINESGGLSKDGRRRSSSVGGVTDPNQWLDVHRELKTQIHTARQQLKQREAASTAQSQHSLSAEAKASLVRAAANIAQLEDGLRSIGAAGKGGGEWGGSRKLGDGEVRRRKDMLAANRKEVEGLEAVLRSLASSQKKAGTSSGRGSAAAAPSESDKSALFSGAPKTSGRVLGGGPLKETERTRELDNSGVLQLQKQVMQEQDEDVLSLGKTVSKLKDMGIMINEELTVQNEMLGLVEGDVERLQGKIDVGRARIKKIH
ncbi:hypothetical protein MBLNU230_g0144t1 [Neophaeotheca triangularis]